VSPLKAMSGILPGKGNSQIPVNQNQEKTLDLDEATKKMTTIKEQEVELK
jgi:hypothetical protein